MNKKLLREIINEEVNHEIGKLNLSSPKKIEKVINELFTFSTNNFLKNIGSQETILDDDAELSEENWDFLLNTINESYHEDKEEWHKLLKNQKEKVICYKYFTGQEFLKLDSVESDIKINIKKYFTALQNFADLDNFREKFFNLPFETLSNFVRLLLFKSPTINKEVKLSKKELKDRVKNLKEDRLKMIKKISLISKKYQNTFDISKLKDLYDNGLFYEDNILNRAVNEYTVKFLNDKSVAERIKDKFNSAMIVDMQYHAENSASYAEHIEAIRKEEGQDFFTAKGYQIGSRFDNAIEVTESKSKQEDYVVDNDSRFKEPVEKIKDVHFDAPGNEAGEDGEEGEQGDGGIDVGGGFSGGGGITSSAPATDFSSIEAPGPDGDVASPDDLDGGEEGEDEMPTDDDGFPADFGTPETNPEGAEEGGSDDKEKK